MKKKKKMKKKGKIIGLSLIAIMVVSLFTAAITAQAQPDLVITNVWTVDGKIHYTIANQGDAAAPRSFTGVYANGRYVARGIAGPLAPGEARDEEINYRGGDTVCADYQNRIPESNEDNNCNPPGPEPTPTPTPIPTPTPTPTPTPSPGPDLVITNIWTEDDKIHYTIANQGDADAPRSFTGVYINGRYTARGTAGSLAPGEARDEEIKRYKWTCPDHLVEIKVCADYQDRIDESNEDNNCKVQMHGGPDLVLEEKTATWEDGTLTVTYTVSNCGPCARASAPESVTGIYIDSELKGTDTVPALEKCTSYTSTVVILDVDCPPGEMIVVTVKADYDNAVEECNEMNNEEVNEVECPVLCKPDLVLEEKTATWEDGTLTVTYTVSNCGPCACASAPESVTGIYIDGELKGTDTVPALEKCTSHTSTVVILDVDCPPGETIVVTVKADYEDAIDECDETNNEEVNEVVCPRVEYRAVIAGSPECWLADNDAYDMYNRLLSYPNWKAENIRLLVDDCTRANIQAGIAWMASQADADDVCLFFYAGHGTHGTDIAPIDEADGWDEYICPEGNVPSTFIRDDELDDWMTPIEGKKVVMIDSCFSGGFVKGPVEGVRTLPCVPYAELTDGFVRDLNKPGYATLTAADDDESAYGSGDLNNGVFTYYVDEGLAGPANADADNDISAEEAFDYAEPRAIDYTAAHPEWYPAPQHPQLYDGVTGELPVVEIAV